MKKLKKYKPTKYGRICSPQTINKIGEINMQRTSVDSSNLASVGYDKNTQTLEIEFHHGGVYQYFSVPQSIYEELMAASSHGKYFDQNIKKAGYEYQKVS